MHFFFGQDKGTIRRVRNKELYLRIQVCPIRKGLPLQGGPLLVISGVITPINGLIWVNGVISPYL